MSILLSLLQTSRNLELQSELWFGVCMGVGGSLTVRGLSRCSLHAARWAPGALFFFFPPGRLRSAWERIVNNIRVNNIRVNNNPQGTLSLTLMDVIRYADCCGHTTDARRG